MQWEEFFYSDLFIYYDKCNCNACNKKSCKYRIFCFFGNYYFRVLCDILNFGVSKRSSNISKRMHNSMKMEKNCYNKYLCSKISNYLFFWKYFLHSIDFYILGFQTINATSQNCTFFSNFAVLCKQMCVDLDPDIIVTPLSWTMDIDLSSFDNSFGPNTFKCNVIIIVVMCQNSYRLTFRLAYK